jgi:uncharacterized protein (TIGR03000 family)
MSKLSCSLARWGLLTVTLLWLPFDTPAAEPEKKPVVLEVTVPDSAEVYIDGTKTRSTGPKRKYISDPVAVGKTYYYIIKGVWKGPDGKEVVREVTLHVAPDKVNELDLTREQKPETKTASLSLEAPKEVDLDIGSKKTIPLTIKREYFKGEVKISFSGVPPGITIGTATIPADKNEGNAEAIVEKDAKAGPADIVARAESGETRAEAKIKLTIKSDKPKEK